MLKKNESHLEHLLKTFDKSYLEELFEEGSKDGLFQEGQRQNYKYEHGGWTYIISRYKPNPLAELKRRFGM